MRQQHGVGTTFIRYSFRMGLLLCTLVVCLALDFGFAMPVYGAESQQAQPSQQVESQANTPLALLNGTERLLEQIDTNPFDRLIEDLNHELKPYLPPLNWRGLMDGGGGWDAQGFFTGITRYLMHELFGQLSLLGSLLLLAVLFALLQQWAEAFPHPAVGKLASAVLFLSLAGLALVSFGSAVDVAKGLVERLVDFMLAMLPLLTILLAGTGALASAGIFHPLLLFAIHLAGSAVGQFVLPALYLLGVLELASRFTGGIRLDGLVGLGRQLAVAVMGTGFALFLGVMTVQGAAGSVTDGIALRTGKYLAKTFVPVVGGMFADAAELVVTASLLVRNAIGIAGMIALLLVAAFPLLKLVALVLMYRLAAALAQPLGVSALVDCLQGISTSLTLIAAAAAAVALLFFFSLTILLGLGNLSVMLR